MFKKKSVGFLVLCFVLLAGCKSGTTREPLVQPTHRPTALATVGTATYTATAVPIVATVEPTLTPTSTRLPHDPRDIGTVGPPVVDTGLFYGEPCSPPCWEGITPGVTSKSEALLILDQLVRQGKVTSYIQEADWLYFAQLTGGEIVLNLDESYRYVSGMSLRYGYLRFDFRVWEIIDRFGEPEAVFSSGDWVDDNPSCEDWEDVAYRSPQGTATFLLYPSQGVTIVIAIPSEYYGYVCPEMRATAFDFYPPKSLANALQQGYRQAFEGNNLTSEDLVPWHGYGPGY
jgi:hypothetical protein